MREELSAAATDLIRDYGKPIRTFSGASLRGHAIWIATYHDSTTECKSFSEDSSGPVLEAFSNLWGQALEFPLPDFDKYKTKSEEHHINGCQVVTSIMVLDGSGYFFAVRFPEEGQNWKARQIVTALGPNLIRQAEEAYNTKQKRI